MRSTMDCYGNLPQRNRPFQVDLHTVHEGGLTPPPSQAARLLSDCRCVTGKEEALYCNFFTDLLQQRIFPGIDPRTGTLCPSVRAARPSVRLPASRWVVSSAQTFCCCLSLLPTLNQRGVRGIAGCRSKRAAAYAPSGRVRIRSLQHRHRESSLQEEAGPGKTERTVTPQPGQSFRISRTKRQAPMPRRHGSALTRLHPHSEQRFAKPARTPRAATRSASSITLCIRSRSPQPHATAEGNTT